MKDKTVAHYLTLNHRQQHNVAVGWLAIEIVFMLIRMALFWDYCYCTKSVRFCCCDFSVEPYCQNW